MRAAAVALHVRYAVTRQLEIGARLRTGWNFHANFTINRLDINLSTECCFNHVDMLFGKDNITFASK